MSTELNGDYHYRIWRFEGHVGAEMALLGDWYGVSLTSPPGEVQQHIWNWSGGARRDHVWILGDSLHRPKDGKVRPEDVTFTEMDDSIGGIIIPGLPNPSRRKVEPVKDELLPERSRPLRR